MKLRMMMVMPHLFLVAGRDGYGLVSSLPRPGAGRRQTQQEVEAAACLAFHRANPGLLGADVAAPEPQAKQEDDFQFSA
ncbi:MAG: hypothetical protein JNK11_11070 [Alphaproteobacteria bacterium]|nr:hypothetical protein [Alphaproteobacteria bacterium]